MPRQWLGLSLVLAALSLGCSDRTLVVADDAPARAGDGDGGGGSGSAGGPDASNADNRCPAAGCACNDGVDNDGDDVVDGLDPECTGPFDNDEATFGTGEGSLPAQVCLDCFFDGNQTATDDSCRYDQACGADMPGPPPRPNMQCGGCEVAAACVNACRPRTPNGCDCFGCCQVFDKGKKPQTIFLVDGCSLDNVMDRNACPRCKQSPDCRNECGECELCIGKAPVDLEKECGPDGGVPEYSCGDGPVCGKKSPCKPGFYCQQGCCIPVLE